MKSEPDNQRPQTGGVDLLCVGRLCVDLYGEQLGSPLELTDSFRMYVGGSAANIAVGTSRLGVRSAMMARVGDEHLGRFLRRTLATEGVNVDMVRADPGRLSGVVALAPRELDDFPRVFMYADSADMATSVEDIDEALLGSARAVLITGSFLANPAVAAATHRILALVSGTGTRVVLDIDYRPALWGLVPAGEGGQMYAQSDLVSRSLQEILPHCDLVVGTHEEIRIAGGEPDLAGSLATIRGLSPATVVVKDGARGCTVHPGSDPARTAAIRSPGFEVTVLNSVGAGDGFLSGFLSGWLDDRPLEECARTGNAVGALVVSRHGCSTAMPVASELREFLSRVTVPTLPGADPVLDALHRAGVRRPTPAQLHVLAIDHRWQLEEMAERAGAGRDRLPALKLLLHDAFRTVALGSGDPGHFGLLVDAQYGAEVLEREAGGGSWIFRALDVSRSRPVRFLSGSEAGLHVRGWPRDQTAKLMVYAHPDDPADLRSDQLARMQQLTEACRAADRELLIELQAPPGREYRRGELAAVVDQAYAAGARPHWWKLPPLSDPADWHLVSSVISGADADCRGVLVLGQTSGWDGLVEAFRACADVPLVRGFAVGRTIFSDPVTRWLADEIGDGALVDEVAERYRAVVSAWQATRSRSRSAEAVQV